MRCALACCCQLVPGALTAGDGGSPCITAAEQVGTVSRLEVQSSRSNVARVTWVGVPGATAYRVVWSRRDGTVGWGRVGTAMMVAQGLMCGPWQGARRGASMFLATSAPSTSPTWREVSPTL